MPARWAASVAAAARRSSRDRGVVVVQAERDHRVGQRFVGGVETARAHVAPSQRLCVSQVSRSGAGSVATSRAAQRALAASEAAPCTAHPVDSAISANDGRGPSQRASSGSRRGR